MRTFNPAFCYLTIFLAMRVSSLRSSVFIAITLVSLATPVESFAQTDAGPVDAGELEEVEEEAPAETPSQDAASLESTPSEKEPEKQDPSLPVVTMSNADHRPVQEPPLEPKTAEKEVTAAPPAINAPQAVTDTDPVDPGEYGGRVTLGVSLFGAKLAGVPLRIYVTQKVAFELEAAYWLSFLGEKDAELEDFDAISGVVFSSGLDVYFIKIHSRGRIKSHGLFLKGGYGINPIQHTAFAATGWAHERMHLSSKRYSFIFELGAGASFNVPRDTITEYYIADVGFLFFIRFHWSWALKTGFGWSDEYR